MALVIERRVKDRFLPASTAASPRGHTQADKRTQARNAQDASNLDIIAIYL